jgi:uncharacterized protein (DUF362 family)
MSRVFIDRFSEDRSIETVLASAMTWVCAEKYITPGASIFIKPNLTWRRPTPGVTVTPRFLGALIKTLISYSSNIIIGESEGGQSCFQAEEAFQSHGLNDLIKNYGIKVINLSKCKHETATTIVNGKTILVNLPSLLLHEVDVFITAPVPKVHAMTRVSLGFKNQWGCLGDNMRVSLHPVFNETVLAIHKLLKPRLCIFDGTYFLDSTGPMMGNPVPMNLIIAGDDVGATTLACCKVMNISPRSIPHLRLALKENLFPKSMNAIEMNQSPEEFSTRHFHLHRALLNYVQLAAFKNRLLNHLFYCSALADALHEILWTIRRSSLFKRALYGKYGPGEAKRGGRTRT